MTTKGKILFVDDEKRVLNSMRGLFRRDYELFLTTDGAEAVQLVVQNDIDVIVADQRMPGISGVEVLGKVREASPRTVRILLTGYADPEAIEGSINVGEVFRFLSKPCPPKLLKETLRLAIEAAQGTRTAAVRTISAQSEQTQRPITQAASPPSAPALAPAPAQRAAPAPAAEPELPTLSEPAGAAPVGVAASADTEIPATGDTGTSPMPTPPEFPAQDDSPNHWTERTEIVMSGDSSQEVRQLSVAQEANESVSNVGVAIFTVNPNFAESAIRTISPDRSAMLATTLVKVAEVLEQREAGVLVTDFTSNIELLQNMIGTLKQHLPELVTIVVSENRDATDMINLINYGQVFRYVEKPIDSQTLRTDVNAAVLKHLQLLEHPELIQRHQVLGVEESTPDASHSLNQFIGKVTRLRGRWTSVNKH